VEGFAVAIDGDQWAMSTKIADLRHFGMNIAFELP
jgi:hypothetical protein